MLCSWYKYATVSQQRSLQSACVDVCVLQADEIIFRFTTSIFIRKVMNSIPCLICVHNILLEHQNIHFNYRYNFKISIIKILCSLNTTIYLYVVKRIK
jgi:hypothetical protein